MGEASAPIRIIENTDTIAESGERIDELSAYPFKEFILQMFPNCYIMAIEDICRVVEEFDDWFYILIWYH